MSSKRIANPGGKANELIENSGYRFDIGPTLITMPFIINEVFEGQSKFGVELKKLDNICKYHWEDGSSINTHHEFDRLKKEIEKIDKKDAEKIDDYFKYSRKIYDLSADIFLLNPFGEINRFMKWDVLKRIPKVQTLDPFRKYYQGVKRFFKHPKINQLFNRYATYNGSSPYLSPATLNIIPWVEFGLGSYYIKGGIYKLSEQMYKYAESLGVKFHFNSGVDEIIVKNKEAKGLVINGEEKPFDYIVANSDVNYTFQNLIKGDFKEKKKYSKLEASSSGFIILLGVNKKHELLSQHNVLFSSDYEKEFIEIFEEGKFPNDPTIYISISSKSDEGHAPKNAENWFILVNTPYQNDIDWTNDKDKYKRIVFDKLKRNGFDIESNIEFEKIITPDDLFDLYKSNKGSIYGFSSNSSMSAFLRPSNRNRSIKNLFFAGGSSHPGGGVPLVILSGKHCTNLILEDR